MSFFLHETGCADNHRLSRTASADPSGELEHRNHKALLPHKTENTKESERNIEQHRMMLRPDTEMTQRT